MQVFLKHLMFWSTIFVLWAYMKSNGDIQPIDLIFNTVNMALYIGVYYTLRYVQIPMLYNCGKKLLFVFSLVLSSFFFILMWKYGMIAMERICCKSNFMDRMGLGDYLVETIQAFSPTVVLLAWESFGERKKTTDLKNQLEKERMVNELKFLKAQINPHFLINSLNSLHANVLAKEPDSADMILNLSDILDYVLYKGNKEGLSTSEEILIIDKFLKLERKRLGVNVPIVFISHDNLQSSISPLSILSLVESIFRIENLQNRITAYQIEVYEDFDFIICRTIIEPEMVVKHDISVIEYSLLDYTRQMDLIYSGSYSIDVTIEKEGYQILLKLNVTP